jgi:hypothetical protein
MRTKTFMSTKTFPFIPVVLAFLGYCATSSADITGAWWNDDGDGVLVCQTWTYDSANLPSPNLTMTGDQYTVPGQSTAGHMVGTITTDSPQDPTLYLGSAVNNDTSFVWTSYQVNVVMNAPFTFVAGSPYVINYPLSGPSDWTVAGVIAPFLQVSGIYAGDYEGTIDLTGGTPIAISDQPDGELDFGYGIHFSSSTDYSFTQEMIPMGVPEPSDLGLASALLFGGIELVKRFRKKA